MAELLRVEGLRAGYGEAVVIDDIDFAIDEGQSLALLGRNGTGKTTLLTTLVGVTRRHAGSITLCGRPLAPLRPDQRAAAGIGWVPQERDIFKSLTVDENLTAIVRPGAWTAARVYALFPPLAGRRKNLGTRAVGGRAADAGDRTRARAQSAPAAARRTARRPGASDRRGVGSRPHPRRARRRHVGDLGQQNPERILAITDHALVLARGTIVHRDTSAALLADAATLERHLAVGATLTH